MEEGSVNDGDGNVNLDEEPLLVVDKEILEAMSIEQKAPDLHALPAELPPTARLPLISDIIHRSHDPADVMERVERMVQSPFPAAVPPAGGYNGVRPDVSFVPAPAPLSPRASARGRGQVYNGLDNSGLEVYPEIGDDRDSLLERPRADQSLPDGEKGTRSQGSLVTIFSIWTTMMGSSILVMPWAIQEAGLALGVALVFVMGGLAFFPTTLIYKAADYLQATAGVSVVEFQDICARLLGVKLAFVSLLVSLLNLIGAMVVYWILMSQMLYQIGCYFYEIQFPMAANISDPSTDLGPRGLFAEYWNELLTVPFYLVFVLLPLICIKNPTFFTKLSSFGVVSILYMLVFVAKKVSDWGWHASYSAPGFELANGHFPALTGTLSMGFFIHNCILGMTLHHARPQHRQRDTGIAFLMVAMCYAFVGGCYYAAYFDDKRLITDNLLKNFANQEIMALVARCLLFFQMFTVFPLLAYLFRVQLFYALFGRLNVSYHFVIILNAVLVGACLVFASLYPRIGDILRILGAICGLVYVFTLPLSLDWVIRREQGTLRLWRKALYVLLIGLGLANFIAQFVVPLHPK